MIKVFRQIRHGMILNRNIPRYILYAIGEITLVVIGILLALQVNTWKEEKQANDYEIKILKENLKQLKEDRIRFERFVLELEKAGQSLHYLINYLNSDNDHSDSLEYHIKGIRIKNFMVYNKSAYESLKSGGLERISNDSIRTELSQLYETFFPGSEIIVNNVLDGAFHSWEENFNALFVEGFKIDPNGNIQEKITTPTKEMLEDIRFSKIIENSVRIDDMLRSNYEFYLLPQINRVINKIEKEIGLSD